MHHGRRSCKRGAACCAEYEKRRGPTTSPPRYPCPGLMNGDERVTTELLRVLRELSAASSGALPSEAGATGPRANSVAKAVRDALDLEFAYVCLDMSNQARSSA